MEPSSKILESESNGSNQTSDNELLHILTQQKKQKTPEIVQMIQMQQNQIQTRSQKMKVNI